MTISAGRSFAFGDFSLEDDMISACVVDARRGVGREAKGMGMFWRRENERVRCGSGGLGRDSRVTGEGDNWIEGGVGEGSRTGDDDDIKGVQKEDLVICGWRSGFRNTSSTT